VPEAPSGNETTSALSFVWERQTEVEIQSRREKEIAKPIQKHEVRKIEEPIKTSLRFQEVQVQGRSKQITTPLRVQGKKKVQVQVRPQQVTTPLCVKGQKKGRINGLSDF